MRTADTPASVIKAAIDGFVFNCFLADAITQGRITPSTFREYIRIDEGGRGLSIRKVFNPEECTIGARNILLTSLGLSAIAADSAMDAVFGKNGKPKDTSELGSAMAIMFQIRCAFAHDPLNPVWTPHPSGYIHTYRITVEVPQESGHTDSRTIELHPPSLKGKHLSGEDFGGLTGYFALLGYCLKQVQSHPRGNVSYINPVER